MGFLAVIIMKKEIKDMLLANGTWLAIGLVIGFGIGGMFVIALAKSTGLL